MKSRMRTEYCGLGWWRPQALQRFATVGWFTVFATVLIAIQGVYLGYLIGVLTSIEKRFEIPSTMSGTLLSIYDIGHSISVLIVGHFGSRLHQPQWLAGASFLSSFACFGLLLPHLIFGAQSKDHLTFDTSNNDTVALAAFCVHSNHSVSGHSAANQTGECPEASELDHSNHKAYAILALFQLVAGVASSPFTTLTYVYIDDNATLKQSPFYMGVMTAMWAFGPALGFGLSSYTSNFWITLEDPPEGMHPDHDQWVSAWWLGLVILCVAYVIIGLPFLLYPKSLKKRTGGQELAEMQQMVTDNDKPGAINRMPNGGETRQTIRYYVCEFFRIPLEFLKIVRNPIFFTMSMTWVCQAYLIGGYSTFLPKYLENVFYQPTFKANIYGGIITVMGVATATAAGGKVLSILNAHPSRTMLFNVVAFVGSLVAFIVLMFVTCGEQTVNGLTHVQFAEALENKAMFSPVCGANLTGTCVCDPNAFAPVCHTDTMETYTSPCYLGCPFVSNFTESIDSCQCTADSSPNIGGVCRFNCHGKLAIYMIGGFLGGAIGAFFQMALLTNFIWAVPKEKKTNAMALGNFFMSAFGFIPSQVLYGKIFDSTCILWNDGGGCSTGNCFLFDHQQLRYKYHVVTAGFQIAALVFTLTGHFFARNFPFPGRVED